MSDHSLQFTPSLCYIPYERETISHPTKGFVFAPRYPCWSTTRGRVKSDHREFQHWALRFCRHHGLSLPHIFDNEGSDAIDERDVTGRASPWRGHLADNRNLRLRRREILEAMERASGPLDVIAYFGHGGKFSMSSAGFRRGQIQQLAETIARKTATQFVVVLNACRCGERGGFADRLCQALQALGKSPVIYAHEHSAHTVSNAFKRRYPGGEYVVSPSDTVWGEWRRRLRDRANDPLYARYPFLERRDLIRELDGRPPAPAGRWYMPCRADPVPHVR